MSCHIPHMTGIWQHFLFGLNSSRRVQVYILYIWILARYDIVRLRTMSYVHPTTSYVRRTMSGSTSHVRHRTYDITYDIARTTSYVFPNRRCYIRHRTCDVRCRRFRKIYFVYDVVCEPNLRCRTFENVYRIRCRRCLSYTMSYVFAQTYDVVCNVRCRIFLLYRQKPTIS